MRISTFPTRSRVFSMYESPSCAPKYRCARGRRSRSRSAPSIATIGPSTLTYLYGGVRSEEHTSELQSQFHLVCRLLLEKKKQYESTVDLNQAGCHPTRLFLQ